MFNLNCTSFYLVEFIELLEVEQFVFCSILVVQFRLYNVHICITWRWATYWPIFLFIISLIACHRNVSPNYYDQKTRDSRLILLLMLYDYWLFLWNTKSSSTLKQYSTKVKTLLSRKSAESPRLVAVSWMNSTWVQINSRLRDSTVIHKITSLSCFVDLPPISNTNCNLILAQELQFNCHKVGKINTNTNTDCNLIPAQELTFNCHRAGMTGPLLPPKSLPVCLVNQVKLKGEEIKNKTNKTFAWLHNYIYLLLFNLYIMTKASISEGNK